MKSKFLCIKQKESINNCNSGIKAGYLEACRDQVKYYLVPYLS